MKLDVIKLDAKTTMIDNKLRINILNFFFKYSNELSIRTCTLKKLHLQSQTQTDRYTIVIPYRQIHYSKSLQ